MNNDQLHEEAVKLLIARQATTTQGAAKGTVKSYNARRKDATSALQPVLMEIWKRLESGESVGGFTSKEAWSESQGITIRWCQAIIAGPKAKAKSLRLVTLEEGMTVKIDGQEIVLTAAMLGLLVRVANHIPAKKVVKKVTPKKAKSTGILHAIKTGWGSDAALCDAPLIRKGFTNEYSNVAKGKAVTCPKCLEIRAAKAKKAIETKAINKKLREQFTEDSEGRFIPNSTPSTSLVTA